ncbi:MAG: aminoacyl-tRNA hydrolase [Microscillaceae bacterium]|nr:aminoacyl-tRNA hydrolase [Microscillaceae bacterium]
MKYLIVGLGNPGPEYVHTRHNVGFMVLDRLAEAQSSSFQIARLAEKAEIKHKGRTLILLKPSTFMNLSGKAVQYWLTQFKISRENLLVIVDDLALPFAKLRLRPKGSAGGHNGLTHIEQLLQTDQYARLRFGIGNDYPKGKQAEYVLSEFDLNQQTELEAALDRAAEIVLAFATLGLERTMTQFNE